MNYVAGSGPTRTVTAFPAFIPGAVASQPRARPQPRAICPNPTCTLYRPFLPARPPVRAMHIAHVPASDPLLRAVRSP